MRMKAEAREISRRLAPARYAQRLEKSILSLSSAYLKPEQSHDQLSILANRKDVR